MLIIFQTSALQKLWMLLFLLGSQQPTGKAQVLFHLGTTITLGDAVFFLNLSQGVKCFFFQTVKDRHMLTHKGNRAKCQLCSHTSKSCFSLSSVAKEPKEIHLLTGPLCSLLVLSWNLFLYSHLNSYGVRDLWIPIHRNLPNKYLPPSISAVHPSSLS